MRRSLAFLPLLFALAAVATSSASCNEGATLLRAKVIEDRSEVVGGPVSVADVGDYLLENDQIRVAILRSIDSPGPGIFGGSIVDIDRRRPQMGFEGGNGRDRFAETFPIANLMVPEPDAIDIRVIDDGSSGEQAIVRVEGRGEFLYEALGILRSKQAVLDLLFPDVIARLSFSTDYILHPGARHIMARTVLLLDDTLRPGCPALAGCDQSCDYGYATDDNGCFVCECSDVVPLDQYDAPVNVFGLILGDNPEEDSATKRAGLIAGDFVFFGNQNDVFAPGPGFDEDFAVQGAQNDGQNTFQAPLTYDFVAAAGGDISYGYFTVPRPGEETTVVNVPLFASAATAFLAAGKSCLISAEDDAECDRNRAFVFDRYIAVGDGDVASVAEEVFRVRGIPTGEVAGHVFWEDTVEPVERAKVFVFADPDPGRDWQTLDELIGANLEARGDQGLMNAIDADLGVDPLLDGDYRASLPVGRWVLVARSPDGTSLGAPVEVEVVAGQTQTLSLSLPSQATVFYRITDQSGLAIPVKLTFVDLDALGQPLLGDGRRRPLLGDGRRGNGVRTIELSHDGEGELAIEPGRYRIIASRGPEYGLHVEPDVTLTPGQRFVFEGVVPHEVDTRGWMSIDMHLHSRPSFDSGLPIHERVTAAAAEGVEIAVSTDHDVSTDYRPTIAELGMEPMIQGVVGAEITTLEQGHFIGFPLKYDELIVPTHGAHDWVCQPGQDIVQGIRGIGDEILPLTIVAHPRDGFFGYIDQLGVDTYRMTRSTSLLTEDNPVFRVAGCDFDAMEIISAKRIDLTRTPTVSEMVDWVRCQDRLGRATTVEELSDFCPEVRPGLLVECLEGERFASCRDRNRTRLAWELARRILERTPEEQFADRNWPDTMLASQELCDPNRWGDEPLPDDVRDLPCSYRPGQVDDFFRLLDHGMTPTQIGSSDSHGGGKEPGSPRTYFRAASDAPANVPVSEVVESVRGGHAFATYGPFVRASVAGKTYGEVVSASPGQPLELELDVLTASWFGVDRVEIYLNGDLYRILSPDVPASEIVDVRGKVSFTAPSGRDSHLVVIAMGLKDENLMGPLNLDVPFGEIQLSRTAADAFSRVPVVNELFAAAPVAPDWTPIAPFAITNPIYIDVDGNGLYDAPLPTPAFCSRPCDPGAGAGQCPNGQTCLSDERVCGFEIPGRCERRVAPAFGAGHDG